MVEESLDVKLGEKFFVPEEVCFTNSPVYNWKSTGILSVYDFKEGVCIVEKIQALLEKISAPISRKLDINGYVLKSSIKKVKKNDNGERFVLISILPKNKSMPHFNEKDLDFIYQKLGSEYFKDFKFFGLPVYIEG